MRDAYGNTSEDEVVQVTYSATLAKIKPDTIDATGVWGIADEARIHPAFP